MKRYRVEFSREALDDIERSFEWGRKEWGEDAAIRWYRKLTYHTRNVLSMIPLAQPIAPESRKANREIRHLMFGRYRILFEVEGKLVKVFHVKGAYTGRDDSDLEMDL
jgi:plasmid stabilization system protein ParE